MNFAQFFPVLSVVICIAAIQGNPLNSTKDKKRSSEDYYQNYDYEVFNSNNSLDVEFSSDSLIIPIPEEGSNNVKIEENVEEFNSNADLKNHNFIDNLVYIYYGATGNKNGDENTRSYASKIIIGGSLLSCIAEFSTILLVLIKNDFCKKDLRQLFLHLICSFCVTNLAFIFGIFKTQNSVECLMIALLLSYFHLTTSVWIFIYCYYIYNCFCNNVIVKRKYLFSLGYGVPFIFLLISFILAPESYETKKFCFMSVQKGMIFNYMLPVFCSIILTAFYCIKGIRHFNIELDKFKTDLTSNCANTLTFIEEVVLGKKCTNVHALNLQDSKSCLRRLCVIQTSYDIVWFFSVLALENLKENSSMAVVYAFTNCCLNWYMFVELKIFFPVLSVMNIENELVSKQCNNIALELNDSSSVSSEFGNPKLRESSSDSVPLLIESTEMKNLQQYPNISTITN